MLAKASASETAVSIIVPETIGYSHPSCEFGTSLH